ncbi:MAG: DUF4988 domain-containing protein [Muribaculum sp.]|nr:DUF4988 domain-containing protein [Muribaculum sp.]
MNKQFKNMLLCGAVVALSAGAFTSCDDDDNYDTRISVLETAMADLQAQINKALTVGASVTNVQENNGTYVITLSDGQVLTIKPGTGGGAEVSVTLTDTEAIIKVGDTEYKLPLGSAVNSLIYSPEYLDGEVRISDTRGAVVKFLARPALNDIDGAEFTIAESHELKSRAMGEEDFKVANAELVDGFVNLTVLCINGELAGTKHTASVQMNYKGALIGSNYFTIEVSSDFSFSSEEIDPAITVKGGSLASDGVSYQVTVNAEDLSAGIDIAALFENAPAGATYRVASSSKQPEGDAQAKQAMLAKSLASDGKFDFVERPGTTFGEEGFLVNLVKDEVVKAKTYIKINDPLAGVNIEFPSNLRSQHMEYGEPKEDHSEGAPLHLHKGVNHMNIAEILMKGQLALGHGDAWKFVEAFANYANDYVYANGKALVMSDDVAKYCKHSQGIKWFNVQTSIVSSQRRNWTMSADEMKAFTGGECNGEIIGGWDGITGDDMRNIGFSITPDGYVDTTEDFPGYGLRVGMGVELEYDYGKLSISPNCLVYLFFGRRSLDEGVVDPAAR